MERGDNSKIAKIVVWFCQILKIVYTLSTCHKHTTHQKEKEQQLTDSLCDQKLTEVKGFCWLDAEKVEKSFQYKGFFKST